jgi:hypothetical protein
MITKYKKFFENRNQLEIPFDGKDPLKGKPKHIHILDYLEHIGKYGNLKSSKINFWNLFEKEENIEKGFEYFYNDVDYFSEKFFIISMEFLEKYPYLKHLDIYDNTNINVQDNHEDEIKSLMSYYKLTLIDFLSKKGLEVFKKFAYNYFKKDVHNVDFDLIIDENGLITIFRAISFDDNDAFEKAVDYKRLGEFWSYEISGAYSHGGKPSKSYIIEAKVRPEDINYPMTIYKSVYDLNNEKEIQVNVGTNVLITNLYEYKTKSKFKVKKLLVCPV